MESDQEKVSLRPKAKVARISLGVAVDTKGDHDEDGH